MNIALWILQVLLAALFMWHGWLFLTPPPELVEIMKSLHRELKTIGFEPDRQNLVPHLTLGRIKFLNDKPLFQKTLERFKDLASREMTVDSFLLYESILRREGPEYRVVKVVIMSNEE